MNQPLPRNPLHSITPEKILTQLVDRLGWDAVGAAVPIRRFMHDPSISSMSEFFAPDRITDRLGSEILMSSSCTR